MKLREYERGGRWKGGKKTITKLGRDEVKSNEEKSEKRDGGNGGGVMNKKGPVGRMEGNKEEEHKKEKLRADVCHIHSPPE